MGIKNGKLYVVDTLPANLSRKEKSSGTPTNYKHYINLLCVIRFGYYCLLGESLKVNRFQLFPRQK